MNNKPVSQHQRMEPTEKRKISKAEINELPLLAWEGPIELIESIAQMEIAAKQLSGEQLLGFDTETRPSFKRGEFYPPALIQMATADKVFLFRISKTKSLDPLIPILESPDVTKCGVGIHDDVKQLQKFSDFKAGGFLEISKLTLELGYENRGLRALAGLLLGGRISKAAQVSNWARDQLDQKQIKYAATDAFISRAIYLRALSETKGQD